MKKTVFVVVSVLILSLLALAAYADGETYSGTCGENAFWTLGGEGNLAITGSGEMTDYPNPYYDPNGAAPWYQYRDRISSLVISEGITSVGSYSFSGCSNISGALTLPETLERIGGSAFEKCKGFTGALNIPSGVTAVGTAAFSGCSGFTGDIPLSAGVSYESRVFLNCGGFTGEITIPSGWETVPGGMFYGCSGITGVKLNDNITSIGRSAFYGCTGLAEVTIPASVVTVESSAFRNCRLERVIFEGSAPAVADDAFECSYDNEYPPLIFYYDGKEGWSGPKMWQGDSAWSGFYALKIINDEGDAYFDSGECGEGVTWTIYGSVHGGGRIVISGEGKIADNVKSNGGYYRKYEFSTPRCALRPTELIIEEGVTSIGKYAFFGMDSLKELAPLPKSLVSIGDYAFSYCENIGTALLIPENVETIGKAAFWKCSALPSLAFETEKLVKIQECSFKECSKIAGDVGLPQSVTAIEYDAFRFCSALGSDIVIPRNVRRIDAGAFVDCANLENVYFNGDAPTTSREHTYPYGTKTAGYYIFDLREEPAGPDDPAEIVLYYFTNRRNWDTPRWHGYKTVPMEPERMVTLSEGSPYLINDKHTQITEVSPRTSYADFLGNLKISDAVLLELYDTAGNLLPSDYDGFVGGRFKIRAVNASGDVEILFIFVVGDIDSDGEAATPADAMFLARFLAGWDGYTVSKVYADIDRDGRVTLRDAVILARFIAGWEGYETLPYGG